MALRFLLAALFLACLAHAQPRDPELYNFPPEKYTIQHQGAFPAPSFQDVVEPLLAQVNGSFTREFITEFSSLPQHPNRLAFSPDGRRTAQEMFETLKAQLEAIGRDDTHIQTLPLADFPNYPGVDFDGIYGTCEQNKAAASRFLRAAGGDPSDFFCGPEGTDMESILIILEGSDPILKHQSVVVSGHIDSASNFPPYLLFTDPARKKFDKELAGGKNFTAICEFLTEEQCLAWEADRARLAPFNVTASEQYRSYYATTQNRDGEPSLHAPGANDDLSGSAAALEALLVLLRSGFKPRRSLVLMLASGEEQGLVGAKYFATRIAEGTIGLANNPLAMVESEMSGWAPNGTWIKVMVEADSHLGEYFHTLATEYLPGVPQGEVKCGYPCSDYAEFMGIKVPATMIMSAGPRDADFDPHYHSALDTVDKIDFEQTKAYSQLALSYWVELGIPAGRTTLPGVLATKPFVLGDRGNQSCPTGYGAIPDAATCAEAAGALGVVFSPTAGSTASLDNVNVAASDGTPTAVCATATEHSTVTLTPLAEIASSQSWVCQDQWRFGSRPLGQCFDSHGKLCPRNPPSASASSTVSRRLRNLLFGAGQSGGQHTQCFC